MASAPFERSWACLDRDYLCARSATCFGSAPAACPNARSLSVSASARRQRETASAVPGGCSLPLPDDLGDEALEVRLYPASAALAEIKARRPQPDWPAIHRELRRKGVTLQLLWEEHRAAHPDGHGYSRFCEVYRTWEGRLSPTMRQTHVAGERLFVDYAGTTLE